MTAAFKGRLAVLPFLENSIATDNTQINAAVVGEIADGTINAAVVGEITDGTINAAVVGEITDGTINDAKINGTDIVEASIYERGIIVAIVSDALSIASSIDLSTVSIPMVA